MRAGGACLGRRAGQRGLAFGHPGHRQPQLLDHRLPGARHERDLARMRALQVLGGDADLLERQVAAHEIGVAVADVDGGHAGQHGRAAEHLGLEALALAAGLDQLVDQHLHRVGAVAHRVGSGRARVGAVVGQHEVVHPAQARERVVQAGRHAGAQHGDQHHVLAGGEELVGQQLHAGTTEVVVEVVIARDRQCAHASSPARLGAALAAAGTPAGRRARAGPAADAASRVRS